MLNYGIKKKYPVPRLTHERCVCKTDARQDRKVFENGPDIETMTHKVRQNEPSELEVDCQKQKRSTFSRDF